MEQRVLLQGYKDQNGGKSAAVRKSPLLRRYEGNPIIAPQDIPGATQVYNAGVAKYQGEYLLLCTVLTDDPLPYLMLARSPDGVVFAMEEEPLITAEPDEKWICDPRITLIGHTYYILYWSGSTYGVRSVLSRTVDFRSVERMGYLCEPDNRNMVLFPEKINGLYARLDRPYGASHDGSIWISYSPDLVFWGKSQPVADRGNMFQWEGKKIGPCVPPMRTAKGWLVIYHGCRGGYHGYYLGCMLLDLKDPALVIGRSKSAILSPVKAYERNGAVPNVVFSCGATEEADGKLNVYYAGADTCICLATANRDELVERCLADGVA
jgi:predicted GH43/DUF377 family glycosyl hydrolase